MGKIKDILGQEESSTPDHMRIGLYGREDGIKAVGVELDEELLTMEMFVGKQITMTVVGIERRQWEGTEVR